MLKAVEVLEYFKADQMVNRLTPFDVSFYDEAIEEIKQYEQKFREKEFKYRTECQNILSAERIEADKMADRLAELTEEFKYEEPKKTLLERAVRVVFTVSLFLVFCALTHYSKAGDTLIDILIFLFFIGLIDVSNLICDFYTLFVKDNTKGSK